MGNDSIGSIDPFTFSIIRHRFFRIVEEAIIALKHVSGSPLSAEGHDTMGALYKANGDLLVGGFGYQHHMPCAANAVKHIVRAFSEDPGIFEGDVFLANDPYTAAIHAPDIYMIAPIHHQGKLVGFAANFVHVADVGSIDPGGFCPRATEIYHEGFVSRGIKLVERGKIRKDILETILGMVRDPEIVALEFRSQIAANNVATMRMNALMDDYGADLVMGVGELLLEESEMLMKRRLLELPDGTWRARHYTDYPGKYIVLVAMTKQGDIITFDFAGTSEQAVTGINSAAWATWGALCAPAFPLIAYDIPWNEGVTRPFRMIAPEGSLVNPTRPASTCIATVATVQTVNNVATICLSKMLGASRKYRDRATGVWHGSHQLITTFGLDPDGRRFVAILTDTMAGAAGARSFRDGVDVGGEIANIVSRWANVETQEERYPLIYVYRRLVRDSGGPGKYRGGLGHEFAVTPHDSPARKMSTVLCGRGMKAPMGEGVFGGYFGCNSDYVIFRRAIQWGEAPSKGLPSNLASTKGESEEHVDWGTFELNEGDVLYVRYMGGGGYGDPLDRDPELVARDVVAQLVSVQAARDVHGVVLDPVRHTVNQEATARQRQLIRQERLGGKPAVGNKVPVPETDWRVNEYLQIVATDAGKYFQCTWCGSRLWPAGVAWKDEAVINEYPITRAGPLRADHSPYRMREFCCPECATLLDTEIFDGNDGALHDEVEWSRP